MDPTPSSTIQAANTALIELGRAEAIEKFFASDYLAHVTGRDIRGGHKVIADYIKMLHRAFSKIQVQVEILVERDDRIAWQRTIRGVQSGAFKGFPASGRNIVWQDMVTSRFHEGLISEEWVVTDLAERLLLARKG